MRLNSTIGGKSTIIRQSVSRPVVIHYIYENTQAQFRHYLYFKPKESISCHNNKLQKHTNVKFAFCKGSPKIHQKKCLICVSWQVMTDEVCNFTFRERRRTTSENLKNGKRIWNLTSRVRLELKRAKCPNGFNLILYSSSIK